jgi:membrane-bound lytic murein transglycosylase D
MTKTAHTHLAAAWLAGFTSLAAPAWTGPLDANRALIITDNAFTADKTILDQACLMIELNYRMDEDEGLIFDAEAPEVVLGRIPLRNLAGKSAEDSLARAREVMRMRVCDLAVAPETEWNEDQKALRKRFPAAWSQGEIALSAQRLTAHRGMRKSFRSSLEASLPYLAMMDSVFRAEGLPTRLKYLPHVESRFNPEAVSPAGAAGLWQFVKTSGMRYLVIDERIDQRFDPDAATRAAALYLKFCRGNLGSWPLAIMSYNSGPGQILDAVAQTGTRDPGEIIRNYQAGAFGQVSRAYYAMFLAASSLAMQADKLYPGLRKSGTPAPAWKTLRLEHEWTPRQLRLLSGYSTAVLMRYNPALRPVVFDRNLPLPRGFDLRLPIGLPSRQDLQFADLRIAGNGGDELRGRPGVAGLPVPKFAESALMRVRQALFAGGRRDDQPVMAYMHSQGLLDADRLALARQDRILIEPHPALQAMLRSTGG